MAEKISRVGKVLHHIFLWFRVKSNVNNGIKSRWNATSTKMWPAIWSTSLCNILPQQVNSVTQNRKSQWESNYNIKYTNHTGKICNQSQAPALNKAKKNASVCQGFASTEHFVVVMERATNRLSYTIHKSWQKNKTSPLNQTLTCTNCGIFVATSTINVLTKQ